jgi:hypothetical protein
LRLCRGPFEVEKGTKLRGGWNDNTRRFRTIDTPTGFWVNYRSKNERRGFIGSEANLVGALVKRGGASRC